MTKRAVTASLMIIIGTAVGIRAVFAIGALAAGTLNHAGPPMQLQWIASLGISLFLVIVGLIRLLA